MHKATPRCQDRWGAGVMALHWGTVACVVILLGSGWLLNSHAAHIGQRTAVLEQHASLGILLLAATIVRIFARLAVRRPPGSGDGRFLRASSRLVQAVLYITLLALIATGIVVAAPRPFMPAVEVFGLWPLPRITGISPAFMRDMPNIHSALVWGLLGLVGLHVAAAIHGTLIRGDQTIFRMLPWVRPSQDT